jgi:tetratricopeptide (TPR) repeat protein
VAPQSAKPVPLELFYSYSHKDKRLRDKLDNHLSLLQREEFITEWNDRMIEAGDDWESEINEHLESAQIILLLVSDDFIASDYCYSVEMRRALERHGQEEARVIPIILRPVDWESSPLGRLQALPEGGKAVTLWRNRDEAFRNVAKGIRKLVRSFKPKQKAARAFPPIPRRPAHGFVARRDEGGRDIMELLREELAPGQNQLVTLSGPGGIGKTTLATEAARELRKAYADRVVWSSAEGRTDFTLSTLLDDIATQLGRADLRTLAPEAKEEQVGALVAEAPTLVVLDNYETVTREKRMPVKRWFMSAQCSFLFTCRPPVKGTVLIKVAALSPEQADELFEKLLSRQISYPQIFTPEVRQRVYKTAEANPFVMQWVMAQIDLAQEPDSVLAELESGEGEAARRVFDRSFDLPELGDDGRDVLLALSLFTPSATPRALSAVSGLGDEQRVKDAVQYLTKLWLIKGVGGNRRLAVEGLTRSLAAARLSKDPRADEFSRRFVAYFLRYAVEREEPTPENYDALEAERENLLDAAETAYTSGEWESVMGMADVLANPMSGMLSVRGYWDEAVRVGEQALHAAHCAKDERTVAVLSHNVAVMYSLRGELAATRRLYKESLEIMRKLGDEVNVAISLHQLAILVHKEGEIEEARQLYNESLEIKKRVGNERSIALTLHQLGKLAHDQGKVEEARRLYSESLEIKKRLGDQALVATTLHQLGILAQHEGEVGESRRLYEESLEISKRLGNQDHSASTLHQLGRLAEKEGDKETAARLFHEALIIWKRLGSPGEEMARRSLARVGGKSS